MTIDGIAFARKGGHLDVEFGLSECERLVEQLSGGLDSRLLVSIDGFRDADGWHCLTLAVQTKLQLRCQRCLEEVCYRLQIDRHLRLVKSEAEIPDDDLTDDSIDVIVATREMSVLELIEEEILLELPMVAMHDNCVAASN